VTTWASAGWADLVFAAEAFRDGLSPRGRQDIAYFRCSELLRADPTMLARAEHSGELVRFLNAWTCRLHSAKAPPAFARWIREHTEQLEALDGVALVDPRVPGLAGAVGELYDGVIAELRPMLRNIGDACASKALHQLLPELIVMWDKAVKRWAIAQGCDGYADYLVAMHELARRLLDETGLGVTAAEADLQQRLGYPKRKPLSKTLDEANLHWAATSSPPEGGRRTLRAAD
jgi:hypothetical protein